jgi:enamine deaminase RidA (YjgF/YER057c/UK114 family)
MSDIEPMSNVSGSLPGSQTVQILDITEVALKTLVSPMKGIIRTRIFVQDLKYCEEVAQAMGRDFDTMKF